MLSVLKNTKTPVKFWFLKNYLSPAFKVEFFRFSSSNRLFFQSHCEISILLKHLSEFMISKSKRKFFPTNTPKQERTLNSSFPLRTRVKIQNLSLSILLSLLFFLFLMFSLVFDKQDT